MLIPAVCLSTVKETNKHETKQTNKHGREKLVYLDMIADGIAPAALARAAADGLRLDHIDRARCLAVAERHHDNSPAIHDWGTRLIYANTSPARDGRGCRFRFIETGWPDPDWGLPFRLTKNWRWQAKGIRTGRIERLLVRWVAS